MQRSNWPKQRLFYNLADSCDTDNKACSIYKKDKNIERYVFFEKKIKFAAIWDQPQASVLICLEIMREQSS